MKPTDDRRIMCSYTIPTSLVDALAKRSQETGENKSRLAEKGLRLLLAMPAEAKEDEGESVLADTRSTKIVREVLKKAGAGPWSTLEISHRARLTWVSADKALGELHRAGEVHLWGRGGFSVYSLEHETKAGQRSEHIESTGERWDLQSPTERVGELIAKWKSQEPGAQQKTRRAVRDRIAALALSIDDLAPIVELADREMGRPRDIVLNDAGVHVVRVLENAKQRIEREALEAAEKHAAWEAAAKLERAQAEAKHKAEAEKNDRLDKEARKARMPPPPPAEG